MAEYQLSQMIIGIILIIFFVSGIVLFMNGVQQTYSTVNYTNSSMQRIQDSFSDIENITNQTKHEIEQLENREGILNTLDAFFTQGYSAIRISKKSVDTLGIIVDEGVSDENIPGLGSFASLIKSYFYTILLVIVFIGLFLAFIIKSDRV